MFGERLRRLRKEKDLTQKQLADKVGVSRATLAGYEVKGVEPSHSTLISLADELDCSVDYLLGVTEIKAKHGEIKDAIASDEELLSFWEEMGSREDLQLLFKQTRNLSSEAITSVVQFMKAIEDEHTQGENRY
jgi:transcriptional regulator with XRE-family HTH domain